MLGGCVFPRVVVLGVLMAGVGEAEGQVRRPPPSAPPATGSEEKASAETMKASGDARQTGTRRPVTSAGGLPRVRLPLTEWRRRLSPMQYHVTRLHGTEQAFTGAYWNHHGDGIYVCVGCQTPLFDSRTKFESGTGWPSYWATVDESVTRTAMDVSTGEARVEVLCRVCDAHLGHVFKDGPRPTGLRYCMNSAALRFVDRPLVDDHLKRWRVAYGLEPAPEGGSAGGGEEGKPSVGGGAKQGEAGQKGP